jgi:putative membrane protein
MKAIQMNTVRHLVRAFIMAGFAYYISVLVKHGGITYYIAPSMEIYIKLAAIALLVIAAFQGYLGVKSTWEKDVHTATCDSGGHHDQAHHHEGAKKTIKVKTFFIYGMFVFPLLLGLFLPDAVLNSALAAKKGVNLSSTNLLKKNAPAQTGLAASSTAVGSSAAASEKTSANASNGNNAASGSLASKGDAPAPADVSSAVKPSVPNGVSSSTVTVETNNPAAQAKPLTEAELDKMFYVENEYDKPYAKYAKKLYKQPVIQIKDEGFIETITVIDMFKDSFIGKKIELSGFVYRENDLKPDQFVVARFAIQCCSADGMPFGFVSEYPHAQNYAKDSWVKVTGTIGKTTYNENEIVQIRVEKVSKIETPQTPYVYPNYNYMEKA